MIPTNAVIEINLNLIEADFAKLLLRRRVLKCQK